jgi:hypothetical protein
LEFSSLDKNDWEVIVKRDTPASGHAMNQEG